MHLLSILLHAKPAQQTMPPFIRKIEDIGGVRVVRLQGPVGMEIGSQVKQAEETAGSQGAFSKSLLLDFQDTTELDFSTVSYLVEQLQLRLAAHARVGIINPSRQLQAELEIARLNALFPVFATEEKAIAELGKAAAQQKG